MDQPRPRPARWAKPLFDAPTWLYGHRLGWLLGRRFLSVTHVGRTSGRLYETVLEVVVHDRDTGERIVASAYGAEADWFQNLQRAPARLVQTGRDRFVPEQRFLEPDEVRAVAARFREDHPLEARVANRVMAAIGAVPKDAFPDAVELFASFPMVAFRPKAPA
jgi:deazaflavin-dependent oxidoreductase (nitroreductase family)